MTMNVRQASFEKSSHFLDYMGDKLGNLEKKVQNMGKLMIEHTSEKRRILA
jgi:hypothetical protein